jgi:hypothetical protein
MRRMRPILWAAMAITSLAGCSGKPKLVPVTGIVKLDGKTVDGVRVYFWPKDQSAATFVNQFAIGFTDKEGKFFLRGTNGDGVEAGEYKVTFARPMTGGGRTTSRVNQKLEKGGAHETLPLDLTDPTRTRQTATVSPSSKEFTFDLSTK